MENSIGIEINPNQIEQSRLNQKAQPVFFLPANSGLRWVTIKNRENIFVFRVDADPTVDENSIL